MKKLIYTIALALILNSAFNIQNSQAQWVPTTGPGGSNVNCLSIVNNDIFAGCSSFSFAGVYYSYDQGNSWRPRGFMSQDVKAVIHNGTYLFCGGNSGAFLSTNYGVNWFAANNGLGGQAVYKMVYIGNTLFAGTSSGVYITTNNGGSWTQSGISGSQISAMLVKGTTVFAGTYNSLYRSTNNGGSWAAVNTGLGSGNVNDLASNASNIFVAVDNKVYISSNNGSSWSQTSLNTTAQIYCIAAYNNYLIAGTFDQGIFRSANNGSTWTTVSVNKDIKSIIFFGSTAYLSSHAGQNNSAGVWRSDDYGQTWAPRGLNNQSINDLAVSGTNVYACLSGKVLYTSNNGNDWNNMVNTTAFTAYQCLTAGSGYVFAGTSGEGIFRTSNNGVSWVSVNTGLISQDVQTLLYSAPYIYAGTNGAGVFRSSNNGDSWTSVNAGISNLSIMCLASGGSTLVSGGNGGAYVSTNNGNNWTAAGLTSGVYRVTVNGSVIVASTFYNGVYRSTNNGQSWSACGFSGIYVSSLISDGTRIFAGCGSNGAGYGIFMSTNLGISWINRNQGFEFPPSVRCLVVANNYIFAGTDTQSVWRRSMTDIIGITPISTEIPSAYSLSQNYPNPFNPITKIRFDVGKFPSSGGVPEGRGGLVTLKVYDLMGREVATLVNEQLAPGTYETTFDGSALSSGTYFYKLTSGDFSQTKKLTLLK